METILITGASGFVGAHLVARLRDQGHDVRGLVRRREQLAALEAAGARGVVGDLDDGRGLAEALDGVDAVVHAAGGGRVRRAEDYDTQNAGTTRTLLAAIRARPRPPRRLVLVSSLAAHGPAPDGQARAEDAPARPRSRYGRAKRAAEEAALAHGDGLTVAIVRPPPIYGPGDTRMLPLFRAASRGWAPTLRGARTTSLIHVSDCVEAIAQLLRAPLSGPWLGCVEDGAVHDWRAIMDAIAAALDAQPRRVRLPVTALTLAAGAVELVARVRGRAVSFNRDKALDMRQPHWVCRADGLRQLGWRARVAMADGMRETARWYRAQGWL